MKVRILTAVLAFGLLALGSQASAKQWTTKVGAHFGVSAPLFEHTAAETKYLNNLSMRLATGILVQPSPNLTFDFEASVSIPQGDDEGSFWFTPGIIYDFHGIIEVGIKVAFAFKPFIPTTLNKYGARIDLGLMPLIQKTFNLGGASYFVRIDLPIFMRDDANFGMQFHTGISF